MLTNDKKWDDFCNSLDDYVNDESGSCSGSDHDSYHSYNSDDSDNDSENSENSENSVWKNMGKLMENLQEIFPDVEYHTVKCFHNKEGMDRMIDIGFETGEYSVCGDHEGSHCELDHAMNSLKNAKKKAFMNKLGELFLWKFCVNKNGAQLLGQSDNCMYCASD